MVRAASYEKIEEKMKAPNREKKVNDATITSHISTTMNFLAQLWNFLVLLLLAHKFIFHPVLHNSISSSPIFLAGLVCYALLPHDWFLTKISQSNNEKESTRPTLLQFDWIGFLPGKSDSSVLSPLRPPPSLRLPVCLHLQDFSKIILTQPSHS